MNQPDMIQQLLVLLEGNGVQIRNDSMGGGGGGLCRLKDKDLLIIDRDSTSLETAIACARALREVIPDIESVYLKPVVRDFIDKYVLDG